MAGLELVSEEGFRIDGRRYNELRQIRCRMGVYNQADGSAYIEQGNTKVLATVYGPHEVRLSENTIIVGYPIRLTWLLRRQFIMFIYLNPTQL
jgi:exosome complex component RRP41